MSNRTLRFLSGADVRQSLPMAEAVELMKQAFAQLSSGRVVIPQRTHLDVADHRGVALFMPSYNPTSERIGLKLITLSSDNPQRGLPRIQALMCVLDAETGTPLAIMDGTVLTAIRTGAASGAATDLLARPEAARVAVFGAGVQGRTQLAAVCSVRPIRQVWIYDLYAERAASFVEEMSAAFHLPIQIASSAAEAVREADIICTATVSKTPVFADEDLPPGVHINAVGSYQPAVQEVPAATVARAQLIVDHRPSALQEPGDLLIPMAAGLFQPDHIQAELGELVLGRKPGRKSPEAVTLFKSVGVAIQDLAAADHVLQRATQLGLGTEVPW